MCLEWTRRVPLEFAVANDIVYCKNWGRISCVVLSLTKLLHFLICLPLKRWKFFEQLLESRRNHSKCSWTFWNETFVWPAQLFPSHGMLEMGEGILDVTLRSHAYSWLHVRADSVSRCSSWSVSYLYIFCTKCSNGYKNATVLVRSNIPLLESLVVGEIKVQTKLIGSECLWTFKNHCM